MAPDMSTGAGFVRFHVTGCNCATGELTCGPWGQPMTSTWQFRGFGNGIHVSSPPAFEVVFEKAPPMRRMPPACGADEAPGRPRRLWADAMAWREHARARRHPHRDRAPPVLALA